MTTEIGAFIHALTEDTTPDGAADFVMTYDHSAGAVKKVTPANLGAVGGGIPLSGWIGAAAMTYASADDPTYTATMTGDVSTTYQVGQRIKLTQATGGTKYFIITKVAVSGDTTLTLYGGTDYNLENEAISSPYYSPVKVPFGFPLDPAKWSILVEDTASRTQATPTQNTWYNLGSITISIPIGAWRVYYETLLQATDADTSACGGFATLSTANNSESDIGFTSIVYSSHGGSTSVVIMIALHREKHLLFTSKTAYYLNSRTTDANISALYFRGDLGTTRICAVCAYL